MRLFVLFVPFVDYFSKEENEALEKVEHGLRMADAGKIAWGAADLLKLQERMAAEPRAWTAAQISEIQPHYDRARQAVIMHFREWLDRQAPHGDTLDVVSAFNTKMINVIGADFKKIGLDEQHAALEARTKELLRQAHTITDARQLLRDVDSLLKQATDEVAKRGKQIWRKKLQSDEDIGQLLSEVESLINTYENLPEDQQDLLLMRKALRIYEKEFAHLANERLSWPEFETLTAQAKADAVSALGEEELPWPPDETIGEFAAAVAKRRKAESAKWIEALEAKVAGAAAMTAFDANRLLGDAARPPAYLTEPHEQRREQAARRLEARLDEIKIDWLVKKFNELPEALRERFIKLVSGGR